MKKNMKLWIAFLLNFLFSVFEFVGGIFTGSIAISSDALHDLGDAIIHDCMTALFGRTNVKNSS